jgi:RNA polymerase sigma factor for flagellar operon FliA
MARVAEIAVGLALGFMLEDAGLFSHDGEGAPEIRSQTTAYDSLAWKDTVEHLHAQLSALPEREQMILRQHYLLGVSFDQIASLLSITKGRVSQLHKAALSRLRQRMAQRGRFWLEK